MSESSSIAAAAEKLWDYHHMGHELPDKGQCEAILCFCSSDITVAHRAAELYLEGYAPWLLFSGGFGTGPHSGANLLGWTRPEAEVLADEAVHLGVPRDKILLEPCATNTGENVTLSRKSLADKGITNPKSLILVQKPFMERRTYATFKKVWAGEDSPQVFVTSPLISWEEYPNTCGIDRDTILYIMVGDLQRIRLYSAPPMDFQIPQEIPEDVWEAFELLVSAGYTKNLVPSK
eukprot:gnl/MRDRNA2_/MRDRNA2_129401_c0_seq1.p1 gnl/MRDRNA2_/MRDRNA2_129401_c0~~gnl/MRDRNA2_/MRDRNA2_129401_c0_seq1.p1  ORF type:complete len:234 (-),score=45.04 gnl/MRDRNA2_/MRDRNA2_129401_c0_seq1:30-731(-)